MMSRFIIYWKKSSRRRTDGTGKCSFKYLLYCSRAGSCECKCKNEYHSKDRISADLQEAGIDISDSTFSIKIGADGQVSVDGIQDHAMKQKIENVLSKYSDELMDIYFARIQKYRSCQIKKNICCKLRWMWENFYIRHLAAAYRLETSPWKIQRYMVCRNTG